MNESADLPKTTWVLHSGNTHITNDRSLLVGARDCDEPLRGCLGSSTRAQAIGEVYLELHNNLTLRLKRVRYVPDSKYNLVSDHLLTSEMGFSIWFHGAKVFLLSEREGGAETRIEAMNKLAKKFVFLTKQPPIDYVIEFAEAHPTPNCFNMLSISTQSSDSDSDSATDEQWKV